jgi:hypothetical protein
MAKRTYLFLIAETRWCRAVRKTPETFYCASDESSCVSFFSAIPSQEQQNPLLLTLSVQDAQPDQWMIAYILCKVHLAQKVQESGQAHTLSETYLQYLLQRWLRGLPL